jgi:hypothetical protein
MMPPAYNGTPYIAASSAFSDYELVKRRSGAKRGHAPRLDGTVFVRPLTERRGWLAILIARATG